MRDFLLLGLTLLLTGTIPVTQTKPVAAPPAAVSIQVRRPPQKPYVLRIEEPPQEGPPSADESLIVLLKRGGEVQSVSMREYLTCVVLSELYADFSDEAFKAQIVAARTSALSTAQKHKHSGCDVCADPGCCQACQTVDTLRQKLGSGFDEAWARAENAVVATDGEVLRYDGALCEAVYFSCSGGRTEDAVAVWGGNVPYLRSVASPGEEAAKPYASTVRVSAEQARNTLTAAMLDGAPPTWIGETTRTAGGGVASVTIGGARYSGAQIQRLFGLASTNFTVAAEENGLVFSVLGSGHRVGMSQFGAEAMARQGSTYREILAHYYTGASIERYEA